MARPVCIVVSHEYVSNPPRVFDFVAWIDGHEEFGSSYGCTHDEAVSGLLERIEDNN